MAKQITPELYENSSKYENFYIGKPPFLWYHKQALAWASTIKKGSKILDFGCFDGFFTSRLIQSGHDAFGCDWNKRAVERGQEQYDLQGRLNITPAGGFDAVIALEVIEHFTDPNDFLQAINEVLVPEGFLFISCPNSSSIYRPKTDYPPHHFSRFSENSLKMLLEKHNYEIIDYSYETSIFQLARNFLGDLGRRDSGLAEATSIPQNQRLRQTMQSIANAIAVPISRLLRPLDFVLNRLGVAYLSHIVVARRRR